MTNRAYYLKSVDRLMGLAESHNLEVRGFTYIETREKSGAYIQFAFGTDMDAVSDLKNMGQRCFHNIKLTVGTTGPDTGNTMYPTIFLELFVRHIKPKKQEPA